MNLQPPQCLYVSVEGNDRWTGASPAPTADGSDGPLATLVAARDAIRKLRSAGGLDRPVTVMLLEGTYRLDEPLVLEAKDSGTAECPITYTAFPGQKPVVSGGVELTQWKPYKGEIVQCSLTEAVGRRWKFRQLFFNGERQVRARWPKRDADNPLYGGWAYIDKTLPEAGRSTVGPGSSDRVADEKNPDTFVYEQQTPSPGTWSKLDQVELHVFPWHCWVNKLLRVKQIDPSTRTITIDRSGLLWNMTLFKGNRFIVENVLEQLSEPGEWCLDSDTGTVYFWPPEPSGQIVVPVVDRLFELRGAEGDPVHHVHISDLRFTQTISPFPEHLHEGSFHSPCRRGEAVRLENAEDCVVERNDFDAVGGDGVRLHGATARNKILRNVIAYCGGAGVSLASEGPTSGTTWTEREDLVRRARQRPHCVQNVVAHNTIHHNGQFKKNCGGVQVFALSCRDLVISHNEIHHTTAQGVIIQDGVGRIIVEYNDLHDLVMETCDSGAIMTNRWHVIEGDPDFGEGNVVRFNLIRNVIGCGAYGTPAEGKSRMKTIAGGKIWSPYFAWGIYFDNSGMHATVYGNIVVGTVLGGISLPVGDPKGNLYENNILMNGTLQQADFRVAGEASTGNRFVRNIVCYSDPESAALNVTKNTMTAFSECDYNVYATPGGAEPRVLDCWAQNGKQTVSDYEEWRGKGFDANSIVADPLFVDAENGDYRLRPDSPAFKLGFRPIDVSRVGPQAD